jgi:hypothetical protein
LGPAGGDQWRMHPNLICLVLGITVLFHVLGENVMYQECPDNYYNFCSIKTYDPNDTQPRAFFNLSRFPESFKRDLFLKFYQNNRDEEI